MLDGIRYNIDRYYLDIAKSYFKNFSILDKYDASFDHDLLIEMLEDQRIHPLLLPDRLHSKQPFFHPISAPLSLFPSDLRFPAFDHLSSSARQVPDLQLRPNRSKLPPKGLLPEPEWRPTACAQVLLQVYIRAKDSQKLKNKSLQCICTIPKEGLVGSRVTVCPCGL